jgi:hypothetical protein
LPALAYLSYYYLDYRAAFRSSELRQIAVEYFLRMLSSSSSSINKMVSCW